MSALAALVLCTSPIIHDGDSLRCGAEKIRIANIDAPELPGSPKCDARRGQTGWCDHELGYRARDALRTIARGRAVRFQRNGTDRYGRTLAIVYIDGNDAGEYLISQGLARRWR